MSSICVGAGESVDVQPRATFQRVVATDEAVTTSTSIHEQAAATLNPPVRLTLLSATTTVLTSPTGDLRGDCISANGLHYLCAARAPSAQVNEGDGPGRLNTNSQRSGRGRNLLRGHHVSSVNRLHSVSSGRSIHKKYGCALLYHTDYVAAHLGRNKGWDCCQYTLRSPLEVGTESQCESSGDFGSVSLVECALTFHRGHNELSCFMMITSIFLRLWCQEWLHSSTTGHKPRQPEQARAQRVV